MKINKRITMSDVQNTMRESRLPDWREISHRNILRAIITFYRRMNKEVPDNWETIAEDISPLTFCTLYGIGNGLFLEFSFFLGSMGIDWNKIQSQKTEKIKEQKFLVEQFSKPKIISSLYVAYNKRLSHLKDTIELLETGQCENNDLKIKNINMLPSISEDIILYNKMIDILKEGVTEKEVYTIVNIFKRLLDKNAWLNELNRMRYKELYHYLAKFEIEWVNI